MPERSIVIVVLSCILRICQSSSLCIKQPHVLMFLSVSCMGGVLVAVTTTEEGLYLISFLYFSISCIKLKRTLPWLHADTSSQTKIRPYWGVVLPNKIDKKFMPEKWEHFHGKIRLFSRGLFLYPLLSSM